MITLKHVTLILVWTSLSHGDTLPTCQPGDFHYEYTECDSQGGRWRVSVPDPNKCIGGAPNPPVRGKGCEFTCDAGQYIDIQGDQECHQCPAGTYSLGGGIRFDDWDHLPQGFTIQSEEFSASSLKFDGDESPAYNCTKTGWMPRGNYIASVAGPCAASLVYTANLVKAGYVRFVYQYTDDAIFHFMVQNDQCQSVGEKDANKWPASTEEGEWKTITVTLKSGMNVLIWKTLGVRSEKSKMKKPIMIQSIELSGVAYASECTKCKNGTHSGEGAKTCEPCEAGSYSDRGAAECSKCDDKTQFSDVGAAKCEQRPPCTEDDYFDYNSPCDKENKTTKMFKWRQPKICRDDIDGSVALPQAGPPEACPPCNPGMEYKNGTCHFCKANTHSDGLSHCKPCAPSTAPDVGIEYNWWNSLPEKANLTSTCLSMDDHGCVGETGWQEGMDYIHTEKHHADDAYLVLSMHLGGFRGKNQIIHGKPSVVAQITFVFELECSSKCEFFFMQQSNKFGTTVIEEWTGDTGGQKDYTFEITNTEAVSFNWAFQKEGWTGEEFDSNSMKKRSFKERGVHNKAMLRNDRAKIHSIKVTNTLEGGAATCRSCPRGTSQKGCIACPKGNYISTNDSKCLLCPENTIVRGENPWGRESCTACGKGLESQDREVCVTNCKYKSSDGKDYDFTGLSGIQTTSGSRLFTGSGTQYYHFFNISLCANGNNFKSVMCKDNISSIAEADDDKIESMICRSTIIPPKPGEQSTDMSVQPVSIGDYLVNITDGQPKEVMDRMQRGGIVTEDDDIDVHFHYMSDISTSACKDGRSTIITLRCDVSQKDPGVIELPPKCADGTCDGCNFHFLWRSRKACPLCNEEDYTVLKGECINGEQILYYNPPKHCILMSSTDGEPIKRTQKCSVLPFWVLVSVGIIAGFGIVLALMLIYCWKKNRKLEYKYMKLIANTGNNDCELPAAETCAIDEGDEEEQFDAVEFKENKGSKFFSKIKSMAVKKGDDSNPFQTIELSDKMPLT